MIGDRKVVVCTPAGRRRTMELLAPRLLADADVDRWDIWVNTDSADDLAYLHTLTRYPKFRLVEVPEPITHPLAFRIHCFFRHATDVDTIYVRLDDDIVYYEPGSIGRVARARVEHRSPFLVYGNVLNSGLTSCLHQRAGRIPESWGRAGYNCMDAIGWGSHEFVVNLHRKFLADPNPTLWHMPAWAIGDFERHSINVISWWGEDAQEWAPKIDRDEEAWLAHIAPKERQRPNLATGNNLFVHYAFYTQFAAVNRAADIFAGYQRLLPYDRLESAALAIEAAPADQLTDPYWLAETIASAGLFTDGRPMYGHWEKYVALPNNSPGCWQHPDEFARFLIRTGQEKPGRILDLGAFHAFTSVLMAAYYRRLNPEAVVVAADWFRWLPDPLPPCYRRITYVPHTNSSHHDGKDYDLVLIDADHSYAAAKADYERLKSAKMVAFHDIYDAACRDACTQGGPWALWRELRTTRPSQEILRPDGAWWMGIGLLL